MGRSLYRIISFLLIIGFINQSLLGQSPVIHVGVDNSFFPFEYLDEEKMPAGFDIDLLYALVKESDLEVQITIGDWFIIKDQMRNGEFDMLAGMYYNPDRAKHYDFTMPYIIITHSLFVKNGNKIGSLNELKEDKSIRVVVENSSILHKYLTANGILPERILAVENQLDALLLVEDSYTTCALLPDLQAKYIAKKNGLDDIKTVGFPILPREYAFAVSKGDTVLLNTLNVGLTRMHRSGEYKEIFEKWFGKYNPTYSALEEGFSWFWLKSLFMAIVLVFVYFFIRFRLKNLLTENKSLRGELKQTNQILKDVHKSEILLKRIIEFSPFPIAMIHEEGYFVFANGGFENLFGKQSTKRGSVNHWLSLAIKKESEQNFIKSQFFHNPKDIISQSPSNSVFSLITKIGKETLMQLFFVSLGNGQLLIFFLENESDDKRKLVFGLPNFSDKNSVTKYKIESSSKKTQQFEWEGKRILIVDDDPQSVDYFKVIFRATKVEIITVKNGREAYDQCRNDSEIDLIIMDWLMPIMDGETSTKLIKQLEPTLPIIAITTFTSDDKRTKILQSGCNAYYTKPVDREELLNYINTLFEN